MRNRICSSYSRHVPSHPEIAALSTTARIKTAKILATLWRAAAAAARETQFGLPCAELALGQPQRGVRLLHQGPLRCRNRRFGPLGGEGTSRSWSGKMGTRYINATSTRECGFRARIAAVCRRMHLNFGSEFSRYQRVNG